MRKKRPIYAETYARRQRALVIAALVVLLAALGGGWYFWQRNPRPSPRRYPVMGVRLDQSSDYLDATQLQSGGAKFVYLKATQGASFSDDHFATNYQRTEGLKVGVYHYFSFDSTPAQQAANFNTTVGDNSGSLPIGIELVYYDQYAKHPPQAQIVQARLRQLITAFNAKYHQGVVLMGTPQALATVKPVAPQSPRWVISPKRPKHGAFWQYATAPLPAGRRQQQFASAVFLGSRQAFARLP
ncbi:GH25 family lysozyme [Lacticaseibacillus baoqingensis]|uniref:GH25 family lysozyme n=1 Tax=Lacticaseibacillus baoqingensis TaxID=2486013 RepID=A0ABW4E4L2_9LACO|nr:GH25 family lysozyme [Lacticaseibacillus baoqingensis]